MKKLQKYLYGNIFFLISGLSIYFLSFHTFSIFSGKYKFLNVFFTLLDTVGISFTIIGLVGILGNIIHVFLKKILKDNNKVYFLVDFIEKIFSVSKYFFGLYFFVLTDIFPDKTQEIVMKIYYIAIILTFSIFFRSFVLQLLDVEFHGKNRLKSLNRSLIPFLKKVITTGIWVLGGIMILSILGFNITALIAGAGVGGIAIAFAAQKSIANIFGALIILLNKPFEIGDYVIINSVEGTVKEIGLTYLTIMSIDGHQVMIPNDVIITNNVENFSIRDNRRTIMTIGLEYGTSLDEMKQAVMIIESILELYVGKKEIESYRVNFDMFGDSSLNINITYFSLLNDSYKEYVKQKEAINLEIKEKFSEKHLEMAFPTRELIIKNETPKILDK